MYSGRLIPNRLSLGLVLGLGILGSGCVHDRYVGTVGHDQTYSNRGFGLTVSVGSLAGRWQVADPSSPGDLPESVLPTRGRGGLDLDGDGRIQFHETIRYYDPALRLVSAKDHGTTMDVDIRLFGQSQQPLGTILQVEVKRRGFDPAGARLKAHQTSKGMSGLVAEIPASKAHPEKGALRLGAFDQPNFEGEDGVRRRQVVLVALEGPALEAQLVTDHDHLMNAVLLSKKTGPISSAESW